MAEISRYKGEWTSHRNEREEVWRLTTKSHVFEFRKRRSEHEPLVIEFTPKEDILEEDAASIDLGLKPARYDWSTVRQQNGRYALISHTSRLRNKNDKPGRSIGNFTQHLTPAEQHVKLNSVLLKAAILNLQSHPDRNWLGDFIAHLVHLER